VGLTPYIGTTREGFTGSASTDDLEFLFQLIHLSMSETRIDDVAVSTVLTEARPRVESPEDTHRLMATIALLRSYYGPGDDRHWAVPPLDEFNAFDPQRALEIYKERFTNPGEFVFGFVGDPDVDTFLDLADAYIGSLDGSFSREGFVDHHPLTIGEQITTVRAGQDGQGLVQFQFTNNLTGQDVELEVTVDLLEIIANNRLRDRIREKLSAAYSPFLGMDLQLEPDAYVETYVEVSGDPDRLDEIATEVLADIADLRTNGPTAEQLAIAQEQLFREYELVNNPFLLGQAIFFEEHSGRNISELVDRYDIVYEITDSQIRALARIAFPVGSYIQVTLIPAE
jgi:zinc protease